MADRNSIYEVFRACRLCGGGGGYKMPIVTLEDELDMRHKIRECVRIEVHQDDKMPPLICELCVDKVNDYFEFLQMCRATDSRTRQRLGLPQASMMTGSDSGDCILGVTEPVFVNDDSSDVEPLSRQKNRLVVGGKNKKSPIAKKEEPIPTLSIRRSGAKDSRTGVKELRVSINGKSDSRHSRSSGSASSRRSPSPAPSTRATRRSSPSPRASRSDRDKGKSSKNTKPPSKPASKPPSKQPSKPASRPTRQEPAPPLLEERRSVKRRSDEETKPTKRVKIVAPPPPAIKKESRTKPKADKRRLSPPPQSKTKKPCVPAAGCALCPATFGKQSQLNSHMRNVHSPSFTLDRLACNACGEWFSNAEDTSTHHRWHKSAAPYTCRLCTAEFRQPLAFNKHYATRQCVPSTEVPDVKCPDCWNLFPTNNLLERHRCKGEEGRPGGTCSKCQRKYAVFKNLKKHEAVCFKPGPKRKGADSYNVSPELRGRVVPMQIRVARVDSILPRIKQEEHYDVSHLGRDFGLDKSCVYPYISSVRSIKQEPMDIKQEMDFEDCSIDYESYTDSDSEPELIEEIQEGEQKMVVNPFARKKKSVDALSTLSIKAIFSPRLLGKKKIQRKRKKRPIVKPEVKEELSKEESNPRKDGDKDLADEDDDEVRKTVDDLIESLNFDGNDDDEIGKGSGAKRLDLESNEGDKVSNENNDEIEGKKLESESSEKGDKIIELDNKSEVGKKNDNDEVKSDDNIVSIVDNSGEISNEKESEILGDITKIANGDISNQDDIDSVIECENVELSQKKDISNDGEESNTNNTDIITSQNEQDSENIENTQEKSEISAKETTEIINSEKQNDIPLKDNSDNENTKSQDVTNEQLPENDEFDMYSMFSGGLGSTALKMQSKLKTCADVESSSKESEMLDDRPTISEVKSLETLQSEAQCSETKDNIENNENTSKPEKQTDTSLETKQKPISTEKFETNSTENFKEVDTTKSYEENKSEIEFDKSKNVTEKQENANITDESEIKESEEKVTGENKDVINTSESKENETKPNSVSVIVSPEKNKNRLTDELLNNELDNISDTEMDDTELMKEIDEQISDKKADEEKISLDELLEASGNTARENNETRDNIESEFGFDV